MCIAIGIVISIQWWRVVYCIDIDDHWVLTDDDIDEGQKEEWSHEIIVKEVLKAIVLMEEWRYWLIDDDDYW